VRGLRDQKSGGAYCGSALGTLDEQNAYDKGWKKARLTANIGTQGGTSSPWPPVSGAPPRQSNARFRSFAERYLIERAGQFRQEHLAEDTWACILDAKRAYNMIGQVGRTVED
jgi:hypothetical protein